MSLGYYPPLAIHSGSQRGRFTQTWFAGHFCVSRSINAPAGLVFVSCNAGHVAEQQITIPSGRSGWCSDWGVSCRLANFG